MPDLEAVGEAATGAVVARTLEPAAGEGGDGPSREAACLNCGAGLSGSYCHRCGQRAHVHRTLGAFWHDLVHGVLHLDGKVWRTLPLLAWHPGQLTRRYVEGERAKFVSPMALFLFSVFLMFAVFTLIGAPVVSGNGSLEATAEERAEAQREFDRERAESLRALRDLEARRARLAAARQPTAAIDADIRSARSKLEMEERLFRKTMDLISSGGSGKAKQAGQDAKGAGPAAAQGEREEAVIVSGADRLNAWFNQAYRKAKENPSLLIYKVQNNAYKFSWLLIPISIPFVWLLFLHRRRYRQAFRAYDHTVFVTYSIAFMSLGAVVLGVLAALGLPAGWALLLAAVVPPLHMYRQLKGAYGLGRFSALWRTFALVFLALTALSLFAGILLLLGVLG